MQQTVTSESAMKALGEKIGAALQGGEVIELIGDVGAGKTTLAKGIARGLGVDDEVQSPSFTLSRVYEGSRKILLAHYDFYRLTDPGILADELADTMQQSDTVTVIEWAGIVDGVLPHDHVTVTIVSPSERERQVTIRGIEL